MSVLILNTTGNQVGFENEFCNILKNNINVNSNILNVRGMELIDVDIKGHEVVVVVSHGVSDEKLNDTEIDIGFDEFELAMKAGILNNPTILSQMLGGNDRKCILVYCACNGLSAQTLLSGTEIQNCIGVMASKTPIGDNYVGVVGEVINKVSEFMLKNSDDIISLNKEIKLITEKYKDEPDFNECCPQFYLQRPLRVF